MVPGSAALKGRALDPKSDYRVTMNAFLALGGDNFTVFTEGRNVTQGPQDLDAFESHLRLNAANAGTTGARIRRVH